MAFGAYASLPSRMQFVGRLLLISVMTALVLSADATATARETEAIRVDVNIIKFPNVLVTH